LVKNHDGNNSSSAQPRLVLNNQLIYTATEGGINYPFYTDGTTSNSTYITDTATGLAAMTTGTAFSNAVLNGEAHFLAGYGSYSRITKAGFTNSSCNAYGNLSTFTGLATSQMSRQVVLNNEILFVPNTVATGNAVGIELYKSNGSSVSLVKDINTTAQASSQPSELTIFNSACFFTADNGMGKKLWKTDGTSAGTVPYVDLGTNNTIANASGLEVFAGSLYYAASPNSVTGNELYKTDGAGNVTLVKDMASTVLASSNPQNITALSSFLFFSADDGSHGRELWRSNGTTAGTVMITDINGMGGGGGQPTLNSNPSQMMQVGTIVYFTADDGSHGTELWKYSGGVASLVKDITPGTSSTIISYMTGYNNKLYFTAMNVTDFQTHLWVSDGTSAGTTKMVINPSGSSEVSNLLVYNNDLYFGADAGDGIGKELYAFHDSTLDVATMPFPTLKVSIVPNPAQGYFELESNHALQTVTICSLQGQLVKSFVAQQRYDVSDLPTGVYLVRVAGEGTADLKLVKQ
jgi:ELWxxDGT repeat protein